MADEDPLYPPPSADVPGTHVVPADHLDPAPEGTVPHSAQMVVVDDHGNPIGEPYWPEGTDPNEGEPEPKPRKSSK